MDPAGKQCFRVHRRVVRRGLGPSRRANRGQSADGGTSRSAGLQGMLVSNLGPDLVVQYERTSLRTLRAASQMEERCRRVVSVVEWTVMRTELMLEAKVTDRAALKDVYDEFKKVFAGADRVAPSSYNTR